MQISGIGAPVSREARKGGRRAWPQPVGRAKRSRKVRVKFQGLANRCKYIKCEYIQQCRLLFLLLKMTKSQILCILLWKSCQYKYILDHDHSMSSSRLTVHCFIVFLPLYISFWIVSFMVLPSVLIFSSEMSNLPLIQANVWLVGWLVFNLRHYSFCLWNLMWVFYIYIYLPCFLTCSIFLLHTVFLERVEYKCFNILIW